MESLKCNGCDFSTVPITLGDARASYLEPERLEKVWRSGVRLQGVSGESQSVRDTEDQDTVSSQATAALPGSLAEEPGSFVSTSECPIGTETNQGERGGSRWAWVTM